MKYLSSNSRKSFCHREGTVRLLKEQSEMGKENYISGV